MKNHYQNSIKFNKLMITYDIENLKHCQNLSRKFSKSALSLKKIPTQPTVLHIHVFWILACICVYL